MAGYGNLRKKKDKSPKTWQVLETLTKKRERPRDNERPALVLPVALAV
jgi:hypothetical protein